MRASLLGCPIDILSMAETVEVACAAMRTRQRVQHVALNVAMMNMRFDPVLAADVASSDIVGVIGMGIVWAARALGLPIHARVTGVDLLNELLVACKARASGPIFLAPPLQFCNARWECSRERYPSLVFAGFRDGYFSKEQEADIVREIRSSGADCLLSGCRRLGRSASSPPIVTNSACPSSWEWGARSTFSAVW